MPAVERPSDTPAEAPKAERLRGAKAMYRVILVLGFGLAILCALPGSALGADTAPPQVVEFDFTPKSINVSSAGQTVTVTMRITDNSSGVQLPVVEFVEPTTGQYAYGYPIRLSGTANDGIYQTIITVSRDAAGGNWVARVESLHDSLGNYDFDPDLTSFPTVLSVTPGAAVETVPSLPAPVLPPVPVLAASVPTVIDATAPVAASTGSKSQTLGKTVGVSIVCADEACLARVGGTVRVPRVGVATAKLFKLTKLTAAVKKGGMVRLRLKLSEPARRAIARALHTGRRVTVNFTITVADAVGNTRTLAWQVKLKL